MSGAGRGERQEHIKERLDHSTDLPKRYPEFYLHPYTEGTITLIPKWN